MSRSRLHNLSAHRVTAGKEEVVKVLIDKRGDSIRTPLHRELGEYCGESIYLTVKKEPFCLYIYAIESPDRLMARTAVWDTMPMHCTSVGKAILSFLSETGLKEYNPRTITTIEPLLEELVLTR